MLLIYGLLYLIVGFLVLFFLVLLGPLEFNLILNCGRFSVGGVDVDFLVCLDWLSIRFFGVLMIICGSVYLFGSDYMGVGDLFIWRFSVLLNIFVLSMVGVIFFGGFFWVLVGWDGLGLTSVLLVLYYSARSSWSSGFKTYSINRIGDGFLVVVFLYLIGTDCQIVRMLDYFGLGMLLCLGAFTKSAQFPFSGWLPVAMAAPTPVSALVHSSTLVTSGLYLMVRFFNVLSDRVLFTVCVVGLFTMVMASVAACGEWDAKKVVAYSTLRQLGLMGFRLGVGLVDFCFFHLIIHALFKALLFICVGTLLMKIQHLQDLRVL